MEQQHTTGFADLLTSGRKTRSELFAQLDTILDWQAIEKEIHKHYAKGKSVAGRPSYGGLVLFKMCLLQTWYGLSDYEVEDQVNDRISFSRFVGIGLSESVPDHSVVSRFRSSLSESGAFEKLFHLINEQLAAKDLIIKTGVIVDASITDTPNKPKGKKSYEVVEDRSEQEGCTDQRCKMELQEKRKSGVDTQAKWIKKRGQLRYGYKRHIGTDEQGMIRGVVTTSANESDTQHLEDVLDACAVKQGDWVKADKGYKSKSNDELLSKKKLKNHVMYKAKKNKPLSEREKQFNRLVSRTRYKVERTFGSIYRWFKAGKARYMGLEKMHSQHLLEAIAFNLYRSPGIIVSNAKK